MSEVGRAIFNAGGNLLFLATMIVGAHFWFHETVAVALSVISFHVARGATNLKRKGAV